MAMPPQQSASAVRTALAKPPAAARAPRPDETAALFPGLLAVSLAQTPPPNLLGQGDGGGPSALAAATTGWPFAAAAMAAPTPPLNRARTAAGLAAPVAPPTTTAKAAVLASVGPTTPNTIGAAAAPPDQAPTAAPSAPAPTPATASPAVPPAAAADAAPGPVAAAAGSASAGTYAGNATASSPPADTLRPGLADAWLAAALALTTAGAPRGEGLASPATAAGGASGGAAPADAAGAVAPPDVAASPPATVTRQVTIQLLKESGDAPAPGGRLTLRLDPPQLGRVVVSFEQQGDRLLVTLTAQTPAAERALRGGAGELQQALAGAGGKWQDAQVKIEPASGRGDARPDGDDGGDPGEQPSRRRREREDG